MIISLSLGALLFCFLSFLTFKQACGQSYIAYTDSYGITSVLCGKVGESDLFLTNIHNEKWPNLLCKGATSLFVVNTTDHSLQTEDSHYLQFDTSDHMFIVSKHRNYESKNIETPMIDSIDSSLSPFILRYYKASKQYCIALESLNNVSLDSSLLIPYSQIRDFDTQRCTHWHLIAVTDTISADIHRPTDRYDPSAFKYNSLTVPDWFAIGARVYNTENSDKGTIHKYALNVSTITATVHWDTGLQRREYIDRTDNEWQWRNSYLTAIPDYYPTAMEVDAYWPPDKLQQTLLANVLWPGFILNRTKVAPKELSELRFNQWLYAVHFADGTTHDNVPSMWIRPRENCIDTHTDCPQRSLKGECRTNAAHMLVHCRKSCHVCAPVAPASSDDNSDTTAPLDSHNAESAYFTELCGSKVINMTDELLKSGNLSMAKSLLHRCALRGSTEAHFELGHIYSILNDIKRATLYYYIGASSANSMESTLALAYRHLMGYGVPKSCQVAAKYYKSAAEQIFGDIRQPNRVELISLLDAQRRDLPMEENEDVIRYYHTRADNGDADAQLALAHMYFYGLRGFAQDFGQAYRLLTIAAEQNNAEAHTMLGNLHSYNLTTTAAHGKSEMSSDSYTDVTLALHHYNLGKRLGNVGAFTGLGFLYLNGVGIEKNETEAFLLFRKAAQKGDPIATFYVGLMHLNGIGIRANPDTALQYFMTAAAKGQPHSLYYAGRMHLSGISTAKSCKMAVQLFKMAVERSTATDVIKDARKAYLESDFDTAFLLYSKASEQGFEVAQSSCGWLLSQSMVDNPLYWYSNISLNTTDPSLLKKYASFRYFFWSAEQENSNSQRIIGDYFYYKWPMTTALPKPSLIKEQSSDDSDIDDDDDVESETESESESESIDMDSIDGSGLEMGYNFVEASKYYQLSADHQRTPDAQSMFNLGYMHQMGIGRTQDLEIAKRYYDKSMETNPDNKVGCWLGLASLFATKLSAQYTAGDGFEMPDLTGIATNYLNQLEAVQMENVFLTVLSIALFILLFARHFF